MTEIHPGAIVGFVGLGTMGTPMATRLAEAAYQVEGYDASERAVRSWAERAEGARPAASLDAAARQAAAVILMLPDSAVVRSVLDGLVLAPGTVIVDMSSSEPLVTRELAAEIARGGATLVDAPVSGGVTGELSGRLTIMAGGAPADLERVRPLLDGRGARVAHCGDVGAGHVRLLTAPDGQGHAHRPRPGRGGRHPGRAVRRRHRPVGGGGAGLARRRRPPRARPP